MNERITDMAASARGLALDDPGGAPGVADDVLDQDPDHVGGLLAEDPADLGRDLVDAGPRPEARR
jgi:hypothetical protein